MKKSSNSISSIAVLFVMAALGPEVVWSKDCVALGRTPASDEVTCLKEEKDKLQKEMQQLVEDKQKIVSELEELKTSRPRSKEEKKDVSSHDSMDIMFQMTSLMMSQQQQQQMMMNQMFSIMSMQMQNFAYAQPDNAFGNPFAFNPYANLSNDYGIGVPHTNSYTPSLNPYAQVQIPMVETPYRYPAQQSLQLEKQMIPFQPRSEGFDFSRPTGSQPSLQKIEILKT